jgi:hypothetical protein
LFSKPSWLRFESDKRWREQDLPAVRRPFRHAGASIVLLEMSPIVEMSGSGAPKVEARDVAVIPGGPT